MNTLNIGLFILFGIFCLILFCLILSLNNLSKKEKDFYNRRKEITDFRCYLIELIHKKHKQNIEEKGYRGENLYQSILNKYSTKDFLKSSKSLTLENWFTEEEIKKIM